MSRNAMKPSLGLRQAQQLALTPQLQQSIRLLQMSTAELEQEIEQFLADNPLLETNDRVRGDTSTRMSNEGKPLSNGESGLGGDAGQMAGDGPPSADAADFERASHEESSNQDAFDDHLPGSTESWSASGVRGQGSDDGDQDWMTQRASPTSLRDHLNEQASGLSLSARDAAWLRVLIESVDDDGYLREDLIELEESVASAFESAFDERLDTDEITLGLTLLQSMEPTGVGARNLAECLLLQIQKLEESLESSIAPTETIETLESMIVIARQIISDEKLLSSLGAREFAELCRHLQCDRERLRACIDFIQTLNPKPGSEFQNDAASVVIPDVIAFKTDGKRGLPWQVRLNESAVPRLSINPVYAELIKQDRASSMAPQLQEARWVIKNIQQRFDTILRVAQAIALEQQSFFEQGELAMKPLVLREIAQRCDLHESTVSRVTTNKYILTPKGTFELKYFFTSHVGTDSGGTASSTAIRAKIKQWVAAEDSKKPLSDQQIADRFGAEGIQVARRTIAKYREALRIEPVSQRKKL